jgi:hypothetical protein
MTGIVISTLAREVKLLDVNVLEVQRQLSVITCLLLSSREPADASVHYTATSARLKK